MARQEIPSLKAKLQKADPTVRDYVSELEARNAKLQHQIVKLEADKIERDGRIKALEKERKTSPSPPDLGERLRRGRERADPPSLHIHTSVPEGAKAKVREWEERLGIPESERVSPAL